MTDTEPEVPPPIVPGVARALSPLVRRIAVDEAGVAGANTYLVGIDEIVVIDPGADIAAHLDAIAGCGGDRVKWIITTGAVPDGGAAGLRARTGAEILAVPGIGPDDADGELPIGGTLLGTEFRLTVVDAVGLTEPRVAFLLEEERLIFTGDWLDDDTEVVDPEARAEALRSMRKARLRAVAPVRGPLVEPAAELIARLTS
ncbi:MAG TPA: hypothetical protein VK866_13625 [Acidimicrobiales bacterium]|nr:hypothetical protein [Acidimicrobiales bacterium]